MSEESVPEEPHEDYLGYLADWIGAKLLEKKLLAIVLWSVMY